MGKSYPLPGLFAKGFDQDMQPLVEVVRDTVGRHDAFAIACNARYYDDQGYPGHVNCTDNFNAQLASYKRAGLDPILWPRNAGSYPGYVFTGDPLHLPAGHFGLGHGSGAHAPDEYYVIDSTNPKVAGWDAVVASFADYLCELASIQ